MQPLRATDLLEIWDRCASRHPVDRALVVLAFACPERVWEELCALPVGERNRLLLSARAASFGARLEIVSRCPACTEALEFGFVFPVADFAPVSAQAFEVGMRDGRQVEMRLPDSRDLAAVATLADPAAAREAVLRRCVVGGGWSGIERDDALAGAFAREIEVRDPLAAIAFPVECPTCGQAWRATLDPIDYLWQEIGQRVRVLVREVHILAGAYGWSESDVLALTPARRKLYVAQVGA
jgi:hypothetical protein